MKRKQEKLHALLSSNWESAMLKRHSGIWSRWRYSKCNKINKHDHKIFYCNVRLAEYIGIHLSTQSRQWVKTGHCHCYAVLYFILLFYFIFYSGFRHFICHESHTHDFPHDLLSTWLISFHLNLHTQLHLTCVFIFNMITHEVYVKVKRYWEPYWKIRVITEHVTVL